MQVKRKESVDDKESSRGFVLQPILQRVFQGAVCAVQQGTLLARERQEKITAEQLAKALAGLCSRQP